MDKQTYQLTRKNGKTIQVSFTKKKGKILEMLKSGKTKQEILEAGFNKNTVYIVQWEAKKLGLI